jgi:hypothetical protein
MGTQAASREALIDAILRFLADQDLLTLQDIRSALRAEIDAAGPDALLALKARLVADNGWDYYPRDPLAQGFITCLRSQRLCRRSTAACIGTQTTFRTPGPSFVMCETAPDS